MYRTMTVELSEADTAWLAGLLEGEGSFMMNKSRSKTKSAGEVVYRYPKIAVSMTDEDVITRVAELFGTSVYTMPIYAREGYADLKQQWLATVQGSRAAALMQAMLPWLGARRTARIKEILDEYSQVEPTEIRRQRSNSIAAAKRPRVAGRFVKAS